MRSLFQRFAGDGSTHGDQKTVADAKHLARQSLIHEFGYDPKDIPA